MVHSSELLLCHELALMHWVEKKMLQLREKEVSNYGEEFTAVQTSHHTS